MKSILMTCCFALGVLLSSTTVSALVNEDVILNVAPADSGAWVTVTDAMGDPIQGVIINDNFVTPPSGRVFVSVNNDGSGSFEFVAMTPDGHSASTKAFISRE